MLVERKETKFRAERLKNHENVWALQSKLSSPQQELKLQKGRMVVNQNQAVQEKDRMALCLESERRKVSQ